VVLTTPTVATVGLSITIPFALVSDFVFFGKAPTGMSVSGALLVIGGFLIISCEESIRKWIGKHLIAGAELSAVVSNSNSDS
jgi:drug/metabolite transporter (DMT)-like permease